MTEALLIAVAVAFGAALVITRLVELIGRRRSLLDIPNERSSHAVPTPRIGGIGIICGTIVGLLLAPGTNDPTTIVLLVASLALAALGLVDDLRTTSVLVKYGAQLLTAAAVAIAIGPTLAVTLFGLDVRIDGPLAIIVATIWLTALTNAINFMDGIDGLVGGVVAMACLLAIALVDATALPVLACIIAACLGFLVWNQAPASIFMGDVGSQFLGLLVGGSLLRQSSDAVAVVPVVLLVSPLLIDTGLTLVARARAGKNILAGHREHLYQRLVVAGRSHREVAAIYVVATGATGILAARWLDLSPAVHALAILAIALFAVAYVLFVRRAEARAGVPAEVARDPEATAS